MDPEGLLLVQNGRVLALILNEMSQVHALPTNLCKTCLNIIHPSAPRSSRCFFPNNFPTIRSPSIGGRLCSVVYSCVNVKTKNSGLSAVLETIKVKSCFQYTF
jgi:hypothetical protein